MYYYNDKITKGYKSLKKSTMILTIVSLLSIIIIISIVCYKKRQKILKLMKIQQQNKIVTKPKPKKLEEDTDSSSDSESSSSESEDEDEDEKIINRQNSYKKYRKKRSQFVSSYKKQRARIPFRRKAMGI